MAHTVNMARIINSSDLNILAYRLQNVSELAVHPFNNTLMQWFITWARLRVLYTVTMQPPVNDLPKWVTGIQGKRNRSGDGKRERELAKIRDLLYLYNSFTLFNTHRTSMRRINRRLWLECMINKAPMLFAIGTQEKIITFYLTGWRRTNLKC